MIAPPENFIRFGNEQEQIDYYKRNKFMSATSHELPKMYYKGAFCDYHALCEIVGYTDIRTCVIKIENSLHTIYLDYLKQMQSPEREKGEKLRNFVDNYVLFDLETTGRNIRTCEIIEISAVKVKNNEIIDTFDSLVKPVKLIPKEITVLTGIDDNMVSNAPALKYVLINFLKFIKDEILVGHNINTFDINILYDMALELLNEKVQNDYIDTLDLVRCCLPVQDVKDYKLSSVCDFLGITNDNAHRSLSDAKANHYCYQKLKAYKIYSKNSTVDKHVTANEKTIQSFPEFDCTVDISCKEICLTGDFNIGDRELLSAKLTEIGATINKSIISPVFSSFS